MYKNLYPIHVTDLSRAEPSIFGINNKVDVTLLIDYSFVLETPPGSLLTINPNRPIYLPVREKKFIQTIRMQITDQENRLLDLNDEPVTYMLQLRSNSGLILRDFHLLNGITKQK
jgi:hypothetical protein